MSDEAYTTIARALSAGAPPAFERLEANFRLHERMFEGTARACFDDGSTHPFFPGNPDKGRLKQALRTLQDELPHGDNPPFPRADFVITRQGDFTFDAYYDTQLLQRLADMLHSRWPAGVEQLRLCATCEAGSDQGDASDADADDAEGGWSLSYHDISDPARPVELDEPGFGTEFDAPSALVLDLVAATRRPWQRLTLDTDAAGTGYRVYLDGIPYQA